MSTPFETITGPVLNGNKYRNLSERRMDWGRLTGKGNGQKAEKSKQTNSEHEDEFNGTDTTHKCSDRPTFKKAKYRPLSD